MRSIRIREMLVVVALVTLVLAWPLDRARLAQRAEVAELELGGALDRAELAEEHAAELSTRLAEAEETAEIEGGHRERAEERLAECEGRGP